MATSLNEIHVIHTVTSDSWARPEGHLLLPYGQGNRHIPQQVYRVGSSQAPSAGHGLGVLSSANIGHTIVLQTWVVVLITHALVIHRRWSQGGRGDLPPQISWFGGIAPTYCSHISHYLKYVTLKIGQSSKKHCS